MDDARDYDALLKEFRDLQLRVTRFSAVEQELINTRDRLDQELELYKRLNYFHGESLKKKTREDFLRLVAESVVDIFEVECSLVCLMDHKDPELDELQSEGFTIPPEQHGSLKEQLLTIKESCPADKVFTVTPQLFEKVPILSSFTTGLAYRYEHEEHGFSYCIVGFNSAPKAALYPKLEQRHETIFSIFTKQINSLLINISNTSTISRQLETISHSENEMRKLSLIATKTVNGVIIADTFGRIEWVNDAFTKITGYELDEVKGLKPKDFLQGPDSDPAALAKLQAALEKKENILVTLINYNKSGKKYYNQLEIISVFDDAGRHMNFIAVQRDITSEVQYQSEILRINRRFELVSQNTGIGIFEWRVSSQESIWNDVLIAQYGSTREQTGDNCLQLFLDSIHPEDKEAVLAASDRQLTESIEVHEQEFRIIRRDNGSIRYIRSISTLERDSQSRVIGLLGTSLDITESKEYEQTIVSRNAELLQANAKLDSANSLFELITRKTSVGIYAWDPTTERLSWNDVLVEQYGASRKEIGDDYFGFWISCIHPDDRDRVVIDTDNFMIRGDEPLDQEFRIFRRDNGQERIIHGVAIVERDAKGKMLRLTGTSIDVTDARRQESQILQKNEELSKINAELDNFVYSVSHDLRSPLLSIKGLLTLITKSHGLDEKIMQYLKLADQSVGRLDDTIKEILDYSRNARLKATLSDFNIAELVEQIFADLRFIDSGNVQFTLDLEGEPIIHSDKARVNILLKNIISNSVKYKKPDILDAFVKVHVFRAQDALMIRVTDNGEGIQPKHLDKIFDMFYRGTHTGVGTGLGLYICKEIASKLGGNVTVQSEHKMGTTVTIKLPNLAL